MEEDQRDAGDAHQAEQFNQTNDAFQVRNSQGT